MRGLVGKGREGFGTGLIQHALAHPPDGRADCLRFASPAEATSCLLVMIPWLLLLLLYQLEILQNLEAFIWKCLDLCLLGGNEL